MCPRDQARRRRTARRRKCKCIIFDRKNQRPEDQLCQWLGSGLCQFLQIPRHLAGFISVFHHTHQQPSSQSQTSFPLRNNHTLVEMTVLPILDIYKMASSIALKKLDALYDSAIRFATNAPFHTHHCHLYKLVAWPSTPGDSITGFTSSIEQSRARHHPVYHLFFTSPILNMALGQVNTSSSSSPIPLLHLAAIPFTLQQQMTGTLYKTASNSQL